MGVACEDLLSDVDPAGRTGDDSELNTTPIIGAAVGGVVLLILLLALLGGAIVFRQKKKKASYSVSSCPDPLVGENPVYMSGFDDDHKFSNPLYEDHSNGNCACVCVRYNIHCSV